MTYEIGDIVEVTVDEGRTWIRGVYIMPSNTINGAHIVELDAPPARARFHFADENVRAAMALGTTTKCPACSIERALDCPFVACVACQAFVCFSCAGDPVNLGNEHTRAAYVCRACRRHRTGTTAEITWDARGYPRITP